MRNTKDFIKLSKELRNLLNAYWDIKYLEQNIEFNEEIKITKAKERMKKIIMKVAEELNK